MHLEHTRLLPVQPIGVTGRGTAATEGRGRWVGEIVLCTHRPAGGGGIASLTTVPSDDIVNFVVGALATGSLLGFFQACGLSVFSASAIVPYPRFQILDVVAQ